MFPGNWNFLTTLVCLVESKRENWQWKLKKQNKPSSHFLLLTLSSTGKSSQHFYSLLVRRHQCSRHTTTTKKPQKKPPKTVWNAPNWKKKNSLVHQTLQPYLCHFLDDHVKFINSQVWREGFGSRWSARCPSSDWFVSKHQEPPLGKIKIHWAVSRHVIELLKMNKGVEKLLETKEGFSTNTILCAGCQRSKNTCAYICPLTQIYSPV